LSEIVLLDERLVVHGANFLDFLDVTGQNFDALLFLARSKLNFCVIESLANFFLWLVIQVL